MNKTDWYLFTAIEWLLFIGGVLGGLFAFYDFLVNHPFSQYYWEAMSVPVYFAISAVAAYLKSKTG